MAISTYAELKTAVGSWLNRADLTSRIPEFIFNAHASIFRTLRVREMETVDPAFSITGEYVALPATWCETRSIYLNTSPKRQLSYMDPDAQTFLFSSGTGVPTYYTVVGSNFRFGPVPSGTYTATLVYYAKPAQMTADGDTNWLLTANPDVYLFRALIEAQGFLQDPQQAQTWAAAYSNARGELNAQSSRAKFGGNGMAVRA